MNENNDEIVLNKYKIIRDYITHEDSLINNRLTWLLVSQGLIFSAFSGLFTPIANLTTNKLAKLGVNCNSTSDIEKLIVNLQGLQGILGLLGFTICVISFFGIDAAVQAINKIKNDYNNQFNKAILPELTGGGSRFAKDYGKFSSRGIPIALSCAWVVVGIYLFREHPFVLF